HEKGTGFMRPQINIAVGFREITFTEYFHRTGDVDLSLRQYLCDARMPLVCGSEDLLALICLVDGVLLMNGDRSHQFVRLIVDQRGLGAVPNAGCLMPVDGKCDRNRPDEAVDSRKPITNILPIGFMHEA